MKAGTKVIIQLGIHKGKVGKVLAKKRGKITVEAGKLNVEVAGEALVLPESILKEAPKN